MEIIFTNHDLLTGVMPFANGGYYNYGRLLYKAGQTETSVQPSNMSLRQKAEEYFDLQGRRLFQKPSAKGVYIRNGRKLVVR